jgi:hypothetical protein
MEKISPRKLMAMGKKPAMGKNAKGKKKSKKK